MELIVTEYNTIDLLTQMSSKHIACFNNVHKQYNTAIVLVWTHTINNI